MTGVFEVLGGDHAVVKRMLDVRLVMDSWQP
jgi:hypothetical protein